MATPTDLSASGLTHLAATVSHLIRDFSSCGFTSRSGAAVGGRQWTWSAAMDWLRKIELFIFILYFLHAPSILRWVSRESFCLKWASVCDFFVAAEEFCWESRSVCFAFLKMQSPFIIFSRGFYFVIFCSWVTVRVLVEWLAVFEYHLLQLGGYKRDVDQLITIWCLRGGPVESTNICTWNVHNTYFSGAWCQAKH